VVVGELVIRRVDLGADNSGKIEETTAGVTARRASIVAIVFGCWRAMMGPQRQETVG